jgi:hypothetical protein
MRNTTPAPESGASANIKIVHRRSMGGMCVVDFSSLLLIPVLKHILKR